MALLWVDHNLEIDNLIEIWNLIIIIENAYFDHLNFVIYDWIRTTWNINRFINNKRIDM